MIGDLAKHDVVPRGLLHARTADNPGCELRGGRTGEVWEVAVSAERQIFCAPTLRKLAIARRRDGSGTLQFAVIAMNFVDRATKGSANLPPRQSGLRKLFACIQLKLRCPSANNSGWEVCSMIVFTAERKRREERRDGDGEGEIKQ